MNRKKLIFSLYLAIFILAVSVFAKEDDDYTLNPELTYDDEKAISDEGSAKFKDTISAR